MNEKEMFLQAWKREFGTTLKVLKCLPPEKSDFKPAADKARSARDLAAVFISEMGIADGIVKGQIDWANASGFKPPAKYEELLNALDSTQSSVFGKVRGMSDADWNSTMQFPVGPKQMGTFRKADVFWFLLNDSIHHRGQFSVYLRLVGAKVPAIYGPSADEPWM